MPPLVHQKRSRFRATFGKGREGLNALSDYLVRTMRPVAMRVLLAWERFESGVAYNPLSRELRANPYPFYEELRRRDPVHRMRLQDAWVLTDYAEVDMVLRDNRRLGMQAGVRLHSTGEHAGPGPAGTHQDPGPGFPRIHSTLRCRPGTANPGNGGRFAWRRGGKGAPLTSSRSSRFPCRSSSSPRCWGFHQRTASSSTSGPTSFPHRRPAAE